MTCPELKGMLQISGVPFDVLNFICIFSEGNISDALVKPSHVALGRFSLH